jgi:hypothetical protein
VERSSATRPGRVYVPSGRCTTKRATELGAPTYGFEHKTVRTDCREPVLASAHSGATSAGGADSDSEFRSVPLAAGETAEGDEPHQGDDQSKPEAPNEHQDDPDNDDYAAYRYACDSTAII